MPVKKNGGNAQQQQRDTLLLKLNLSGTGAHRMLRAFPNGVANMKKALLAITLAATLASGSMVGAAYAQQARGDVRHDRQERQGPRMTDTDRGALTDARIAAIKAGLKLTPDQEKLWPGVEAALRQSAQQRQERFAERRKEREARESSGSRADMVSRLRARADHMSEGATDLRKLADAIDPLYKTLDDGQKRRLAVLMRSGMDHHRMAMRMHGERQAERGPDRTVE